MVHKEAKIVVIGNYNVGKTSLIRGYVGGIFVENFNPTTDSTYHKPNVKAKFDISEYKFDLEFIEFNGMERTESRELAIKNGHGFLFVYSITDLDSFNALTTEFFEHLRCVKDTDNLPFVLIGNKTDLQESRILTTEQGTELARKFNNCQFFETTAKVKDDNKFDQAINTLLYLIYQHYYIHYEPPPYPYNPNGRRQSNCMIV